MELWSARGYDATTAAEIAARAGVTERTFFRHFPDKREVLFDGAAAMRTLVADALERTPSILPPFQALRAAFGAVEPLLAANLAFSGTRQRVISETPALQERELSKSAALTKTLADGLQNRGVDPDVARLAAMAGMAAFGHAVAAWMRVPEQSLDAHLALAFDQLSALSAPDVQNGRR
ncbi:TetR/AcrR family transcriptional regulator [Sphingomonas antarctica]|uniref:TetR/AcrR family transcriptional regulator n=1 Tax=Sphingomonas antarctica TaxID=2040274 RepID=UPI0039EC3B6D